MKWLIVTETYRELSNGIKIMHKMCDRLNKLGEEAYLAFITPHPDFFQREIFCTDDVKAINGLLNTPVLSKDKINQNFFEDIICILPESFLNNKINFKKIVRYFGNKAGNCTLGHKCTIDKNNFILSHSKIFINNPNLVLFDSKIDSMFYDDNKISYNDRKLDLIYHGKGVMTSNCEIYENTFYIGRDYPQDRKQLAYLLKQCRYFYTYDSMSNINAEAVAAGAIPIFLNYDPWTQEELDSMELGIFPKGNFLEIKDNKIYATVDLEKFNEDKKNFLNKVKFYEETWDNRFKETVEQIKQYFC